MILYVPETDKTTLPRAQGDEAQKGWRLDLSYLDRIADAVEAEGWPRPWPEQIEAVLLAQEETTMRKLAALKRS